MSPPPDLKAASGRRPAAAEPEASASPDSEERLTLPGLALDDGPGPARPLSDEQTAHLLSQLLAAHQAGRAGGEGSARGPRLSVVRGAKAPRRRWSRWLLAACVLLLSSGAAGAAYRSSPALRKLGQALWVGVTGARSASAPSGPGAVPRTSQRQLGAPTPASATAGAQGASVAPAPSPPEASSAADEGAGRHPGRGQPVAEVERTDRSPRKEEAQPPQKAADDLAAANRLRRQRRWGAANARYLRVMQQHPGTAQAHVATLAAAELQLSHLGNPAGARNLYLAASGGGVLGAEALHGLARSERALGNTAAERAALRRLVEAYPNSLLAERAKRRLATPGGR